MTTDKWVETTVNGLIAQTARAMVDRGYADMGYVVNAAVHFINHLNHQPTNEIIDAIYCEAKRIDRERKAA